MVTTGAGEGELTPEPGGFFRPRALVVYPPFYPVLVWALAGAFPEKWPNWAAAVGLLAASGGSVGGLLFGTYYSLKTWDRAVPPSDGEWSSPGGSLALGLLGVVSNAAAFGLSIVLCASGWVLLAFRGLNLGP